MIRNRRHQAVRRPKARLHFGSAQTGRGLPGATLLSRRNFIQSIFDSLEGFQGKDPGPWRRRALFQPRSAIQVVIKIAAANFGFGRLLFVGKGGILSDPAVSALDPRRCTPMAGSFSRRSHNPGGPHGDFGTVKYNISAGGPAPENVKQRRSSPIPRRSPPTRSPTCSRRGHRQTRDSPRSRGPRSRSSTRSRNTSR